MPMPTSVLPLDCLPEPECFHSVCQITFPAACLLTLQAVSILLSALQHLLLLTKVHISSCCAMCNLIKLQAPSHGLPEHSMSPALPLERNASQSHLHNPVSGSPVSMVAHG